MNHFTTTSLSTLFDASEVSNRHLVVKETSKPINGAPILTTGSKPVDGGYLIFDQTERARAIEKDSRIADVLMPFVGATEFLNGGTRYIVDKRTLTPSLQRSIAILSERIRLVREWRSGKIAKKNSKKGDDRAGVTAKSLAEHPTNFYVTVLPDSPYLVVPENGSSSRDYVPAGWLRPPVVPSSLIRVSQEATLWHFGILVSRMHMAWLDQIGGKLKSDPRYSIGLVYNTFPWPDANEKQKAEIEALAQAVLDARAAWPTSSLADLYDPDTMPANLRKAHAALDTAVDRLYRKKPFDTDRDRVEHLFGLYEKLVNPLEADAEKQNKRVIKTAARRKAKAG